MSSSPDWSEDEIIIIINTATQLVKTPISHNFFNSTATEPVDLLRGNVEYQGILSPQSAVKKPTVEIDHFPGLSCFTGVSFLQNRDVICLKID